MNTNKFEQHIVDCLQRREITPSQSAWERLSVQLEDDKMKASKPWTRILGYAASIALILSMTWFYKTSSVIVENGEQVTTTFEQLEDASKNFETEGEKIGLHSNEVVLATQESETNDTPRRSAVFKKIEPLDIVAFQSSNPLKQMLNSATEAGQIHTILTQKTSQEYSRINVSAEALLYAVMHTQEDVTTYYSQYNIDRIQMLDTVQKHLDRAHLTVDPEVILAEVDKSIEEADFQEGFMHKFKTTLSDVLVAIADRNH